jgi:cation diffusion facilitator CzcD-associated flavoprotein CzcO
MTIAATATTRVTATTAVTALIIGSGFSGLGAADRLDRAGIRDWVLIESGATVGGTWRDNTYPGCACDIPSPLYSFSFDQNPDWTQLFAGQPEILDYLERFSRDRKLRGRMRFNRRVVSAEWREDSQTWLVSVTTGEQYVARFLISGVGLLHRPKTPRIPGLDSFAGTVFHSAEWDHDYDLTGKRVAVIGTGASAIQFVPAIAERTGRLHVFQRSAPWIMPKGNRRFSAAEQRRMRRVPFAMWRRRLRLYRAHEERAEGFTDVATDTSTTEAYARRHLERQVKDPVLRAKLTPDYALGCKRLLISSDYYPALTRDDVELVTDEVVRITPTGVQTADGRTREVDAIIFGTGFDAQDALASVTITGRDRRTLAEAWEGGMSAYLGTTVAGFPNLFLLCGPNTGLGHNSQVFMIERQVHLAVAAIKAARRRGAIDVRPDVQARFGDWLRDRLRNTVWNAGGCTSWYLDPRTGENTLLWPSTTVEFWKRTRRLHPERYAFTRRPRR